MPSPGANGIDYGRFAQSVDLAGVTVVYRFRLPPKARFFGAPPRFFAQEQRNGVESAVGGNDPHPRNRRTRRKPNDEAAMSFTLHVCAVSLGCGRWPLLPFDPISLVLAQRNGVEPPKKSAFLPRRLHHSRERSCLGYLYSSSPGLGRGLVG